MDSGNAPARRSFPPLGIMAGEAVRFAIAVELERAVEYSTAFGIVVGHGRAGVETKLQPSRSLPVYSILNPIVPASIGTA
ncbi:MAG: hypothetical protein ACYTHJ_04020, partial [Planctomycetota bacterium]